MHHHFSESNNRLNGIEKIKTMNTSNLQPIRRWLGVISLLTVLAGCSAIGPKKEERSGVAVQPINYSGYELSYLAVEDPKDPKNAGGGGALNPYGGGRSTMCCFGIPSQWHPDLQVIVKFRIYPEKEMRRVLVKVPPYADGKPGYIWIMVHEDQSAEAVVSNYGPSRPEWPGKVKGYPEPSREYQLKVWGEKLEREKADLTRFEKAIQKPELSKEKREGYEETISQIKKSIRYLEANKP